MEMTLEIPFSDRRQAEIACNSLSVDPEPPRSGLKKTLKVEKESILSVHFSCDTARTLRVGVKAFFDLLVLVVDTMDRFDQ